MTDEIKPALTAEEWSAYAPIEEGHIELPHALNLDRHAAAALCLHGQPFGFAHADVKLLLEDAVSGVEGAMSGMATSLKDFDDIKPVIAAFKDLAARIAALLPPAQP